MPPKTKRQKKGKLNLDRARKKFKRMQDRPVHVQHRKEPETMIDLLNAPETMIDLLNTSLEAADTEDEDMGPSFELNSSIKSDTCHQLETFSEEWVAQLSRDDKFSLAMFLHYHLTVTIGKGDTEASECAGLMKNKSDRTIRDWITQFYENNFKAPDAMQGHYQRSRVLWQNKSLNKKVINCVQQNASVKGRANLTTHSFCEWMNGVLLTSETLELGFPRGVSVETAGTGFMSWDSKFLLLNRVAL